MRHSDGATSGLAYGVALRFTPVGPPAPARGDPATNAERARAERTAKHSKATIRRFSWERDDADQT